jgi:hypothetical protein
VPSISESLRKRTFERRSTSVHRFAACCEISAYSPESSVEIPQTARKYLEQAVYEVVVIPEMGGGKRISRQLSSKSDARCGKISSVFEFV